MAYENFDWALIYSRSFPDRCPCLCGPIWYLVVLVGLKIIVDLAAHIKSHKPTEA